MDRNRIAHFIRRPLSILLLLPLVPTLFVLLRPPSTSGPTVPLTSPVSLNSTFPPCLPPVCSPISSPQESLVTYLSSRFPPPSSPSWPHLWITLADEYWIDKGAANLHYFVYERLNAEWERRTELVMMCMDEVCLKKCEERGWWCFGGWMEGRPEILLKYTYPKLMSMIQILESGRDVFFVDSDVYFVENPYPHMGDLGKYDLQIQEEMINRQINTGWMYTQANEKTISIWRSILDLDMHEVSRDQVNMNNLLKSYVHREQPSGGTFRDFTSETGLNVRVLPKEKFRAYHFWWNLPQWDASELSYLHMTCADQNWMKDYVSASLGYYQDIFSRYSSPPSILTVTHLTGTHSHLVQQMRVLLSLAHYTGRAFVPPLYATLTGLPRGATTTLNSWNVFPLDRLGDWLGMDLREADYEQHARRRLLELGEEGMEGLKKLNDVVDLDVRGFTGFGHAVTALRSEGEKGSWREEGWAMEDAYANNGIIGGERGLKGRGIIRLNGWEIWSDWRKWKVPKRAERFIDLCADVDEGPDCGRLCRDNALIIDRIQSGDALAERWQWEELEEVSRW
ncbi:hypothetical protein BT69DRAFT_1275490 [Atractiella rhizophila]|nr:hypothetical protein BT69DRAFT_1275490 [Atractiella rhizophila]